MLKPRRSRRVEPLKDSDYDHEINLLDHSSPVPQEPSPDAEALRPSTSGPSIEAAPLSPNPREDTTPDHPTSAGHEANELQSSGNNGPTQELGLPAVEVERKYLTYPHRSITHDDRS
jgi:hypothetical protein